MADLQVSVPDGAQAVRLPDGKIGLFDAGMKDEDIHSHIMKDYPDTFRQEYGGAPQSPIPPRGTLPPPVTPSPSFSRRVGSRIGSNVNAPAGLVKAVLSPSDGSTAGHDQVFPWGDTPAAKVAGVATVGPRAAYRAGSSLLKSWKDPANFAGDIVTAGTGAADLGLPGKSSTAMEGGEGVARPSFGSAPSRGPSSAPSSSLPSIAKDIGTVIAPTMSKRVGAAGRLVKAFTGGADAAVKQGADADAEAALPHQSAGKGSASGPPVSQWGGPVPQKAAFPRKPVWQGGTEAEPVWPSNYQKGSQILSKENGGGANYTADQLSEFKAKYGITDTPARSSDSEWKPRPTPPPPKSRPTPAWKGNGEGTGSAALQRAIPDADVRAHVSTLHDPSLAEATANQARQRAYIESKYPVGKGSLVRQPDPFAPPADHNPGAPLPPPTKSAAPASSQLRKFPMTGKDAVGDINPRPRRYHPEQEITDEEVDNTIPKRGHRILSRR